MSPILKWPGHEVLLTEVEATHPAMPKSYVASCSCGWVRDRYDPKNREEAIDLHRWHTWEEKGWQRKTPK